MCLIGRRSIWKASCFAEELVRLKESVPMESWVHQTVAPAASLPLHVLPWGRGPGAERQLLGVSARAGEGRMERGQPQAST